LQRGANVAQCAAKNYKILVAFRGTDAALISIY
jgi:hypothetical protein